MKQRLFVMFLIIVGITLALLLWTAPTSAQGPLPPPKAPPGFEGPRGTMPNASTKARGVSGIRAMGGPDMFGYQWMDDASGATFGWITATVDSGITGDDATGLVTLPFDFKFYGQTWNQVYASTNGILVFGQNDPGCCTFGIPSSNPPNNVIAAYWNDLAVGAPYNDGKVYTLSGGTAPNRYFVVEWFHAAQCCSLNDTWNRQTFEVILYENGNIQMQYLDTDPSSGWGWAQVGIENSTGTVGLNATWGTWLQNGRAILFTYPAPTQARYQINQLWQGHLIPNTATSDSFQFGVQNTGNMADKYDLIISTTWPINLYAADGTTLLTDSTGDGNVDTGSVTGFGTFTVTAKVQAPSASSASRKSAASIGSSNVATITVRSTVITNTMFITQYVNLQSAVPPAFTQVFRDDADGAMSVDLVHPTNGQTIKKATANNKWGANQAVVQLPSGDFFYAWRAPSRCLDGGPCRIRVQEIEAATLDWSGNAGPVSKVTDLSTATQSTYDDLAAVAVAPNGKIGVLWRRQLVDYETGKSNFNIYFGVLNAVGTASTSARKMVGAITNPVNLTNNTTWGASGKFDFVTFFNPRIAATGDNRFAIAWMREVLQAPDGGCTANCWVDDVYYAVRDSTGSEVKAGAKFTTDTAPGQIGYFNPALASLSSNRSLLTYGRWLTTTSEIYYSVLDSGGASVKDAANLINDPAGGPYWSPRSPDAVQMSDGKIAIAWTTFVAMTGRRQTRFAVLGTDYNLAAGPTVLDSLTSWYMDTVSVTADGAGHAIITNRGDGFGSNLYYALVGSTGSVLTQPMIFYTSPLAGRWVETSYQGFGNTTYFGAPRLYLPLIQR